jgi:hypothetical protein
MSYEIDRRWSDRFIPIMRQLIGPHLLVPAPIERDMQQATDLIVLRARDMTIAARMRRFGYAHIYPWEITIRSIRDSGAKTELEKLREGWGDWMFYGHASEDGGGIERWFLIDLHAWRAEFIRDGFAVALGKPAKYARVFVTKSNGDGTHLIAFDVRRFPPCLLIASSHAVPRDLADTA